MSIYIKNVLKNILIMIFILGLISSMFTQKAFAEVESVIESSVAIESSTTSSAISPIFSFDSVSGIISFSVLCVMLAAVIVFLVIIFIMLRRISDNYRYYFKQLRVSFNSLKKDYNTLKDKIDYIENNLDKLKKDSDDKFYGIDRDVSNLSNNTFRQEQENLKSGKADRKDLDTLQSAKYFTIKEKYNLYLNNHGDFPKELNGTECSFSEYGNQLEKKPNGIFYALNCGNNKYEIYPSKNVIIDERMRSRYLSVSFFKVVKGQDNSVEPCILQESMLGKYDIISLGTVYFK